MPPPGNFRPPRAAPQIVGPGRLDLYGAAGAAPCQHLRRAEPARNIADHSVHRAGGERLRELVAGAAPERADPPHPGRRACAGHRRRSDVRVSAGLEGRKDELAVLARDFDAMADRLRANRSAITQLLRDISHELRSPLARMRVAVGLARQPPARSAAPARSPGAGNRASGRLDQPGAEARAPARHGSAARARDRSTSTRCIEEVVRDANFEGAVKSCTGRAHGTRRTLGAAAIASCCAAPSRTCCAMRCAIVRPARRWRSRSSAATARGLDRDSRSRAGSARERIGAYIRAVLPRGGIARPRQRRRRHRPRHHVPGHEGARRLGRGASNQRRRRPRSAALLAAARH